MVQGGSGWAIGALLCASAATAPAPAASAPGSSLPAPPAAVAPAPASIPAPPPFVAMLGQNGTVVGRSYSVCRLHPQPGPVALACEGRVGDAPATGLMTYDSAQVVVRVEVVLPRQLCVEKATREARALLSGLAGKTSAVAARRGEAGRWRVEGAHLRGEVVVAAAAAGGWTTRGTFTDPSRRPAEL